ncbi:U-Kazal-Dg21.2-like [Condylostylus longicornis]|uniref:U-Kazal-Dg21.2-like n=1 Tax=Condylostylus longicornis TaxID=2530218 RepID=UPI00244DF050|nr:U-Kazal-Dg21.2-like [Condylostylus longicornis]
MWKILLASCLIATVAGQSDISQYGPSNLPHLQDCNVPCTLKASEPVCAFDGKTYNVYNDDCELLRSNCTFGYKLIGVPMQQCLMPRTFMLDHCNFACPNIERSICAKSKNNNPQLFKNGCVLARQACKDKAKYSKVDMEKCKRGRNAEDCNRECPLNYDPKCAFNGEEYAVFGNECDLEVANCLQSSAWAPLRMQTCNQKLGYKLDLPVKEIDGDNGNYDDAEEEECPTACKRIFWPVCAFDGEKYKIFSNECLYKKDRCEKNSYWTKTKMSDCISLNMN